MRRRSNRLYLVIAGAVALMLLATACGGGADNQTSGAAGGSNASQQPRLSATLTASGATFPKAFYEVVIHSYQQIQPDVTVNYAGGGSGQGLLVTATAAAFARSSGWQEKARARLSEQPPPTRERPHQDDDRLEGVVRGP